MFSVLFCLMISMKNNGIKRWKSPTLFLFIFAIIWFCIYWCFMFPIHLLMFTWTQVSWVVTDVTVHEDDEDGDTYEHKVKYTCGWVATEQRQGYSSSSHYRVWENVTVYCNENNPTKFAIKSFSNYLMLLFPLTWLLVLYFGGKNLYEDIRRKKLKNKLSQYWLHVEAIISKIKQTGAMVNNIPWCKIIATYDWKIFTSETIYATLKYILKEWDKIDIYIDPINPNDYWMDTDSIFDRPIRDDYGPRSVDKLNKNQSVVQNLQQNFVENNSWGDTAWKNTTTTIPRPPKISDKKCPIHRINKGYWTGIVFSLIWWWILILLLISIIDTMKNEWKNPVPDMLPAILFGWIFLLVWLWALIPKIKRNKKKKRLLEWWIKKEGMVTEVSSSNVEITKQRWHTITQQRWYIITAIYDWKLYKSEVVYADIYYLVEEGDEIDIYVGTWWDEDYRVDVDSIFYREPKDSYYNAPRSIGDVFNNIIKGTIENNRTN